METSNVRIVDVDGNEGLCRDGADPSRVEVELQDGARVFVPRTTITDDANGTRRFAHSFAGLREHAAADGAVIPIVEERMEIQKTVVERERVRVLIESTTRDESVDVPVTDETLRVERVEVRRFVDHAEAPRQDGDTTIVPVYEEVLVVEKRLLLREELHITRVRQERVERRTMPLRREQADVQTTVLSSPAIPSVSRPDG